MPYHHDCCEHGEHAYIGSFELPSGRQYDVYRWEDSGNMQYCIRYGSDVPDYISPYPVNFEINSHGTADYAIAAAMCRAVR